MGVSDSQLPCMPQALPAALTATATKPASRLETQGGSRLASSFQLVSAQVEQQQQQSRCIGLVLVVPMI